ncbi:MAG: BatA domain-containing protein [Deltaproteobacteria bacterium]|nr:BatA domain-containing protein [Deltaproteobacteria bacterium]
MELTFSQPGLLWGLLASALPLLIHLINRHRARRRPFAAVDFLLRVQRRSARRILLKQILLLVIRTLLIALIVLAAAGPLLIPVLAAGDRGPTTSALVIDRSLSMRATRERSSTDLFGEAVERARQKVGALVPGDRICLLAAEREQEVISPCTESQALLFEGLDAIEASGCGWGRSDLVAGIERAAALLAEEPDRARKIVILSDGAAHAFGTRAPVYPAGLSPPEIVLESVRAEDPIDNHAVSQVEVRPAGRYVEISARFVHFASQPSSRDLSAEVLLEGKSAARGFVQLSPGAVARKVFTLESPIGAEQLGELRSETDRLAEDDHRLFWLAGRRFVQALLVNGDMRPVLHQDELFYLEHALAPDRVGAAIRFTTITPDHFKPESLQGARVAVMANVREVSPQALESLRGFVSAGGGLLLSAGSQVDVDRSNRILGELLPWQLRDVVELGPLEDDGSRRKGIGFGAVQLDHPVLSLFSGAERKALSTVRTRRAVVLETGQENDRRRVLMRYANGMPALVEGRLGAGRVLLFTSTLDRDWTNWPARATFLPFLQQAVSYLSGRLDDLPPPEIEVGAGVCLPRLDEADGMRVLSGGSVEAELGIGDIQAGAFVYTGASRPGWYAVQQMAGGKSLSGRTVPGFIVHPPAAESDLRPVDPEALQRQLGRSRLIVVAGGDGAARSLSGRLLLLALALVLFEAVLIRR